jgi:hypothetical protein
MIKIEKGNGRPGVTGSALHHELPYVDFRAPSEAIILRFSGKRCKTYVKTRVQDNGCNIAIALKIPRRSFERERVYVNPILASGLLVKR